MLDALGQCWWLGKNCIPNWEAWAVAAAILGGVGSWIAAAATYFAVLLPFRSQQKDQRVKTRVSLGPISMAIADIGRRISNAESLLRAKAVQKVWFVDFEWDTLRLPPLAVSLDASSDTERFLLGLNEFVMAQNRFAAVVEGFSGEHGPQSDLNFEPAVTILRHHLMNARLKFDVMLAELETLRG